MTLSTLVNRAAYTGDGSTVAFPFPYFFINNADLVVLYTTSLGVVTTKVLTTDYTVTGAGLSAGGTVTMNVAPLAGDTLTLIRDPALTQSLHLINNDPLPVDQVELEFDKITMLTQRLRDLMTRAAKLSDGYVGNFDPTLPAALPANAVLAVNSSGNGLTTGPTIDALANISATLTAAVATATAAAAASATAAASSATAAAGSATAAAASATTASTGATTATTQAAAASSSATAAAGSATGAAGSATTAAGYLFANEAALTNSGTSQTVDFSTHSSYKYTMTGNCTFTPSNPTQGATYLVRLYGGAGGFTIAFAGTVTWLTGSGTAPAAIASSKVCLISLYCIDGTNFWASYARN